MLKAVVIKGEQPLPEDHLPEHLSLPHSVTGWGWHGKRGIGVKVMMDFREQHLEPKFNFTPVTDLSGLHSLFYLCKLSLFY